MIRCQPITRAILVMSLALTETALLSTPLGSQHKFVWSQGQRWKVEVERTSEPKSAPKEELAKFVPRRHTILYEFEFEGACELDGEPCVKIKIDCVQVNNTAATENFFFRLYLRQTDQTLKAVQRINRKTAKIESSRVFSCGPVDATDWVGFLPLAFPQIRNDPSAQLSAVPRSKQGGAVSKSFENCRQSEEIVRTFLGGKTSEAVRVTLEESQDGQHSRRTMQTRATGMPWWAEATHDRDGRTWCSARLIVE